MIGKSHLIKCLTHSSLPYHLKACKPFSYRLLSSLSDSTNSHPTKIDTKASPQSDLSHAEQADQFAAYSNFVEPTAIQSLNIAKNIETMEKPGSIFNNYFLGMCDKDLLNYPFLLKTRKEFLQMNQQYEMIRNTWNKIRKNDETLDLLGYNSLYKLSISEMMYVFEAIGASIEKQFPFGARENIEIRYEKKMAKSFDITSLSNRFNISESAFKSFNDTRLTLDAICPLIVKNSLLYYAISHSPNVNLKDVLSGGKHKIGLALNEPSLEQSSDYMHWKTEAKITNDFQSWVVSGEKCKIAEADYSHYLLFCRTSDFLDRKDFTEDELSIDGVVALLVPSDQVQIEADEPDFFGRKYQKISLRDVKLNRESCEVMKTEQNISQFVNVKGCAQLATSAVILGLLKQLLKNTYAHLVNEKVGLSNCELVQYKLFQATSKIYALESMLYMSAAMFDSFEKGANLEGESISTKILAIEYGYDICNELRSIFGSRYPFSSTVTDLIYSLDSFLDSAFQNRLLLGQRAIDHYKMNNRFNADKLNIFAKIPIYSVRDYLLHRKLRKGGEILTKEMTKYIHYNMHSACEWIESCINRLEYSSHLILTYYEKDYKQRQVDLNRLTSIGMDIFMMISVLSRANHSLCYGIRNNHTEKELCMAICKETFLKHLQLFEDLSKENMSDNDAYAKNISAENVKENGYFASLFRI